MTLKRFWTSTPLLAVVSFLILATSALSQQVPRSPVVTVYESPT